MRKTALLLIVIMVVLLSACDIDLTSKNTVTFNVDGGTEVESIKVSEGETVTEPVDPTQEGFVFRGWYKDAFLISPYDFTDIVEDDITLYAKWNPVKHTVSFSYQDTIISEEEVFEGSPVDEPVTPIVDGYKLSGWYTDSEFTNSYDLETPITEDITLYAKYVEEEVLSFMLLDGAGDLTAEEKTLFQSYLLNELSTQGYEFDVVDIYTTSYTQYIVDGITNDVIDIGVLYGSDYVRYFDDSIMDLLLTKTFEVPDVSNTDPTWWNTNEPHTVTDLTASPYYRGYVVSGPSVAGTALATTVNAGEDILWEDFQDVNICALSSVEATGYVFPNLWIYDTFGYTLDDMTNVTYASTYQEVTDLLEIELCDVGVYYPYAREVYAATWNSDNTIWEDTDIIGVTREITYEAMIVNQSSVSVELQAALATALTNMLEEEALEDILATLNIYGLTDGDDSLYDPWREALDLLE